MIPLLAEASPTMCGIFGVLFPARDLGREVDRMRQAIRHRGPDGEGLQILPTGILGHVRLSIIDLSSAAAQPLWDASRRACITFNGEIYNYKDLREECLRAGLPFRSASDTEVIVNQFLLHGELAFDRLDGIYAFCLFDAQSGSYYLIRDPMGVKPLYWADTREGVFFASELGPLVGTGVVPVEVDALALQAYLQLDFVPAPLSILRGVRKLREGHVARVSPGGRRDLRAYSSMCSSERPSPGAPSSDTGRHRDVSLAEDVREFDRLIHQAVRKQLVADVPVGVFLSGGLDSSIVAQAAAEECTGRISTFSIGFEDRSFDESAYFSSVAAAIGSDHHVEVLRPHALLDLLLELPRINSEPHADGSVFPTHLLSRFTRGHVKVALSGDGADELFAGYPTYRASRFGAPCSTLPRPARRALFGLADRLLPVQFDNFAFDFKVKKFLEGLDRDPIRRNMRWLGTFTPEELPGLLVRHDPALDAEIDRILHEPAEEICDRSILEKLLRTDQRFYLQDGVLVKVDRASMAVALEVRVPFLDPAVVRFARSLPDDRKLHGGSFKHILRVYARGRLPQAVVERPKKGFGTPLGKWFRSELKEPLADILSPARIASRAIFRPEATTRLLNEHWSGRRDHRKRLFNLLAFNLWQESIESR